jgi:hypothetical protein
MSAENLELKEQLNPAEDETYESNNDLKNDEDFKEAVYTQMQKIYNDGMIVGFQTACHTALDKIYAFERNVGKKSANDYKRCLKELKRFFEIGISRKVNTNEMADSEENVDDKTVQN